MTITYNALDQRYQNNDQRYSDWVAQGRPVKDSMGRDLDVRGQVVGNANEIYNYTSQNYADYDRIYGQGAAALEMYNHRDRSRVNPFDQALQPNTPRPSPIAQPVMGNQPSPVQLPAGNRGPIQQPRMLTNRPSMFTVNSTPGVPKGTSRTYGPTYQQYLSLGQQYGSVQESEGGPMVFNPAYTEEQWNSMSDYERHRATPWQGVGTSGYDVGQDDPLYQQFYQQFGHNQDIDNSGFELNNQRQTGLALGYDDGRNGVAGPQYGRLDWNQLALDPSRIMWLDPEGTEGRRYLYERSNARGGAVVGEQARDDDSGLGDNFPAVGLGLVLGGGLLHNALGAGGFASGATPIGAGSGTITGTGALAESVAPQVTGTLAGTPAINGVAGAGAAAAGTGAGSTVANTISQYGRYVTPIVSALTNGGGNGGGASRPTGGGGTGTSGIPSIADLITQLITGGVGNYQANRNIGQFTDLINDMLTRGDPYAGERASAIARLRALESNPGSIVSNPLFRNMNDQSQMDLQRRMSARGMSLSGNELGDLQNNFLANMNRFYGDEWNRTAREAGVFFDPSAIASAGMRAGGEVFSGRQNRDAGLQALIAAATRRGGGQGGGSGNTLVDLITSIFSGGGGGGNGDNGDQWESENNDDFEQWWEDLMNSGGPVGGEGE